MSRFNPTLKNGEKLSNAEQRVAVQTRGPKVKAEEINLADYGLEGSAGKIRETGEGDVYIVIPCPACRDEGGDEKGEHFAIHAQTRRFTCVCYQKDASDLGQRHEHLSKAFRLMGGKLKGLKGLPKVDPELKRKQEEARAKCAALWVRVKDEYAMSLADWQKESAEIHSEPKDHFRTYMSWFRPTDLVWCGSLYDGGEHVARHLCKPEVWEGAWEMITVEKLDLSMGQTFRAGATSRSIFGYAGHRTFFVLEHDKDGGEPTRIEHQIALLRYAVAELGVKLLGVTGTGRGNIHGIVDASLVPTMGFEKISALTRAMGADHCAWAHARTRIPGAIRRPIINKKNPSKSKPGGELQPLVWLPKQ